LKAQDASSRQPHSLPEASGLAVAAVGSVLQLGAPAKPSAVAGASCDSRRVAAVETACVGLGQAGGQHTHSLVLPLQPHWVAVWLRHVE
jgi:hypothetical protein